MRDSRQIPDYDQAKRDARQVVIWSITALLMALPLVLGYHFEVAAINAFGFGWACLVVRRVQQQRQHRRRRSGGGTS